MPIVAPNYALEQSICNYLTLCQTSTASMLSGSAFTCYTGIGNIDIVDAPAIIVDCSDMKETVLYSRNYEFNGKCYVKEMAADTNTANLGVLAEAVFNEFVSSPTACQNFSNPSEYNIKIWSMQTQSIQPTVNEDALVNIIDFKAIGALVPA